MLSDLNWKRANVRAETKCSRCERTLLSGQQSIQIDRARVCISCWDEVRADPTKSAAEYKAEFRVSSAAARTRSSSGSRPVRRPSQPLQPTLSDHDASLLVASALDDAASDLPAHVLSARDLEFHEPGFDYVVVGRAGATIIGSKAYSSAVKIEALVGWASTSIPPNVLVYGRNRRDLIDLAVRQRDLLSQLLVAKGIKFEVPVRAAMCFESVEGIDRTPVREAIGVRLGTAEEIAQWAVDRGPLVESEIEEVAAALTAD